MPRRPPRAPRWRAPVRICSFDQLHFDGAAAADASPPGDGGSPPPETLMGGGGGGGAGGADAGPGDEPSPKKRRK